MKSRNNWDMKGYVIAFTLAAGAMASGATAIALGNAEKVRKEQLNQARIENAGSQMTMLDSTGSMPKSPSIP